MEKTITVNLSDEGVAAYAHLQSANFDIDGFLEEALVDEAHRMRGRAMHAAEVLEHERQHVGLEDMRDLPTQIESLRPPR